MRRMAKMRSENGWVVMMITMIIRRPAGVSLEGVLLACTCFFVLLLRVFFSSESRSTPPLRSITSPSTSTGTSPSTTTITTTSTTTSTSTSSTTTSTSTSSTTTAAAATTAATTTTRTCYSSCF